MQLSLPVCLLHVCAVGVLTSVTGSEVEEARKRFQEEISSVQDLRSTITGALERLRLESDTLQREDASLRAREERMVASFGRLKEKEAHYKERGKKNFSCLYITIFTDGFTQ
jgi:chromosome segregation ATPase